MADFFPRWGLSRVLVFSICWLCTVSALETLGKSRTPASLEVIDIEKEPRAGDWRAFLKADPQVRESLWRYHQKRGKDLSSWSWMWRLGWIRACAESKARYCQRLVFGALFDKALVVRADAAIKIGRRFEGSGRHDIIKLLARAARNPRNYRSGKPLYIQQRLLFAIMQIGGKTALPTARRIAAPSRDSIAYLDKLRRK